MSFLNVAIDESCMTEFTKLKKSKTQKYAVFKLSDDKKTIFPDKLNESDEDTQNLNAKEENVKLFDYFIDDRLPEAKCRYAVYKTHLFLKGGYGKRAFREKYLFISWCPSNCSPRDKMTHASTKGSLKKYFAQGIDKEIHAGDRSELRMEEWIDCLNSMGNIKLAGKIVEFEGHLLDEDEIGEVNGDVVKED